VSLKKDGVDHLIVVPMHRRDLPRGTLTDIVKDAGMSLDEFIKLL
jgi:predicted RNA binding protein YcfA (HicA-like mRNA interferase family)